MEENAYVLLDLEAIKVNIKETTTDPIVFCESIQVKLHETQDISLIDDWSNIIIGNPDKYKELEGVTEVAIAKFDEITGEYTGGINTGIGLWSVILFETIKNEEDEYTGLTIDNMGSGGIGGAGEQESNIKEVYENTLTSINYTVNDCVYKFLENIFSTEKYNGCIFINNNDCGLFLNISPKMFNEQENLKSIALTNTIIYIGDKGASSSGVFSNCINLESANIPTHLDNYFEYNVNNNTYDKRNTTRKVPSYYFYNCNKLNNILIPDGIHNIEYAAFYGCDKVETIDIPSSVTSVFSYSLLTVKRANTRYINVNGDATDKTNITFYNKCIGYNKPITGDKTYVVNSVVISINNRDTVNLMGSNNINDASFIDNIGGGSKIYIDCGTINGVKIGNTINSTTRFYYGGFIGTSFDTIYIGPTVSKICDFAFYNVKNTTNLIINNDTVLKTLYDTKDEDDIIKENVYPDGTYLIKTPFVKSNFNNIDILNCTTIGEYALHNIICANLTFYEQDVSLEIKDNLTITNTTTLETLSNYAFYNSHFGSITIPSTVTSNDINNNNISETAFLQTTGSLVLNCDISNYETEINQNTSTGILVNSGFSKINFNYANSIPANVLYKNEHIQLIELSEGITSISSKAFYLCTNLSGILTIPSTLTQISSDAFIGCRFNEFISSSDNYQIGNNGMYLLKGSNIVLFANRHAGIQIVDNTFDIINIDGVTGIGDYAFAYAFSDNSNSTVLAVNIPTNIKNFGSNVFYNSNKITRITFFASNIPDFDDDTSIAGISVYKENNFYSEINTVGSFVDLPLLKQVYIGYKDGVLLSDYFYNDEDKDTWFLHNTLRKSNNNKVPSVDGITIYVREGLVDDYVIWENAGYTIVGISKGDTPPPPDPPTEDDDEYDADIDDPEGEEWPDDGGNGDISDEEDYIPPITNDDTTTDDTGDSWITHENDVFKIPIKQLGTPSINVYGCRLDLLNTTYHNDELPPNTEIIDQFGNINFSALDYLKFNKVSNKNLNESTTDDMLKLYLGDYGNNFLIVFTVTGIDNFDATTKLFTSGVEYATHRESNWLKTEIVRITKKPKENVNEDNVYYVVLLCTCLKLQNKDNYNCRNAIVSVNYGSQLLDSYVNDQNTKGITTKIRVIQHKTELRLSNDTRELNITDLPVLFCQTTTRTTFTGNFFIGFPKNFWGKGETINIDGTSSNKNKLREYINDYFRILYDKEKINVIGQKINIDGFDYTYTFNVNDKKYANIKSEGSTTGTLMTFELCKEKYGDKYEDKLKEIHEEYYCVNFKIENLKTSLAGGVWNISIYNICEPAEMLNIHVIEDKTDIPSIVLFSESVSVYGKRFSGDAVEKDTIKLSNNACYSIYDSSFVALNYFIPIAITNLPVVSNMVIYPDMEVVDLCVDSSCIIECGADNTLYGTGGTDLFNNYRGVLTLNTNLKTQPKIVFPISSSKLKRTALSSIKYSYNKDIQNTGLYSYFNNSENAITNCSCGENITKIKCTGAKDDSDILENTTTFLYEFNTGVSRINQTLGFSSKSLYTNYLSIKDNELVVANINDDSNSEIIYHDENYVKENNLCFLEDSKIIYDKFYNVLAPFYPYSKYTTKYKTVDSSETQILVNSYQKEAYVKLIGDDTATIYNSTSYTYIDDESEITSTGQTYYCTSTPGIVITADNNNYTINRNFNIYTGKAYLVTDADNTKINIGVGTSRDYTTVSTNNSYMNTSIYSNASTVTLLPLYKLSVDSATVNTHAEINSEDIITACYNSNIDLKHGLVIGVILTMDLTFKQNNNISDLVVYERDAEFYNINNELIDKTTLYECTGSNIIINKWVYIADSTVSSFRTDIREYYYTEVFDDDSNVIVGQFNIMSVNKTVNEIPVDKTFERGNSIYDNTGNIHTTTPTITKTQFTTNSLNIGDAVLTEYNKSVDQTHFRQLFINFYYSILDNGVKTKVYADNTDGILMHLRLINSYNVPETLPTFTATDINIFNFSFNSTSNDTIFNGSPIISPVYPIKKI